MEKIRLAVLAPFKRTAQWMVLFWNIVSFFFHYEIFHFPFFTALFFQIVAFLIEYMVSSPYQKQILKYDKKILDHAKEEHTSGMRLALRRYLSFWVIYCIFFLSTYLLRLWIISLPPVGLWIKEFTLNVFGQVARTELITKDIQTTLIVACVSSLGVALVIPLSLIWKRKILRLLSKWNFKGKLSKKQQSKKNGYGLRSFLSLHIAVRVRA